LYGLHDDLNSICIKCKAGAFVVKCENGKNFNVHEGGKMCQAGAKGTIFLFILCQRQNFVFILFFPSMGSKNDVIT